MNVLLIIATTQLNAHHLWLQHQWLTGILPCNCLTTTCVNSLHRLWLQYQWLTGILHVKHAAPPPAASPTHPRERRRSHSSSKWGPILKPLTNSSSLARPAVGTGRPLCAPVPHAAPLLLPRVSAIDEILLGYHENKSPTAQFHNIFAL